MLPGNPGYTSWEQVCKCYSLVICAFCGFAPFVRPSLNLCSGHTSGVQVKSGLFVNEGIKPALDMIPFYIFGPTKEL